MLQLPIRSLLLGITLCLSTPAVLGQGPLRVRTPAPRDGLKFDSVTTSVGLNSTFTTGNSHTGGCAWVDYNGDFWPDLFITNGAGMDHYLYRNEGDGTFTDVSSLVPKPFLVIEDAGVKYGDVDNDGDSDILVIVDREGVMSPTGQNQLDGGPNLLYENQGDGTFVQNAQAWGIVDPRGYRNSCGGFADFDRDGLLDVFLGNWAMNDPPQGSFINDDRLLRNTGAGTFTDVTVSMGNVSSYGRDSLTCLWFDFELDGYPDLYVGNVAPFQALPDFNANDTVYANNAGSSFTEITGGMPTTFGDDSVAAMGLDVGDIDNDGLWDLYVTDLYNGAPAPYGNALYLGQPGGTFTENVAPAAGVASVPNSSSWPVNFADFNLDGWVDLWVGTAHVEDPDFVFLNEKNGTFATFSPAGFTGNTCRGGSVADYDGDGDLDIFMTMLDQDSKLLRNESRFTGNWMEFKLIADVSNRDAIGALVQVTAGGITQMRRVSGGDSAHSQQDLILHFGVGSEATATVDVTWPNGAQQSFANVGVNELVFLHESQGRLTEDLETVECTFSASAQMLSVRAESNFGGRPSLAVGGLGALVYDAADVEYTATFPAASNPGTITISSDRGNQWQVPVTTIP